MAKPPLRYAGDPDKLRLGGVYVTADRVSQADVASAVRRFWLAAGAAEDAGDGAVASASFKADGMLGVAVLPPGPDAAGEPWIGVYDSAPYSQDHWLETLAVALHELLSAPTFQFYIGPKTRLASVGWSKYVGGTRNPTKSWPKTLAEVDRFPYPFVGYGDVPGATTFRFRMDVPKLLRTLEFEHGFWKT